MDSQLVTLAFLFVTFSRINTLLKVCSLCGLISLMQFFLSPTYPYLHADYHYNSIAQALHAYPSSAAVVLLHYCGIPLSSTTLRPVATLIYASLPLSAW